MTPPDDRLSDEISILVAGLRTHAVENDGLTLVETGRLIVELRALAAWARRLEMRIEVMPAPHTRDNILLFPAQRRPAPAPPPGGGDDAA
jgi:hypothetical protein